MNFDCPICGQPWTTHGTACQPRAPVQVTYTNNTNDSFEDARIRRIVREELERAKEKP